MRKPITDSSTKAVGCGYIKALIWKTNHFLSHRNTTGIKEIGTLVAYWINVSLRLGVGALVH